jgi:Flp pilus assembly protein protease CpaA
MQTFFPDPVFGWVFYLSLLGLLAVASYTDQRFQLIPKKLTLTLLGLGVVFNLVRGAWMGGQGTQAWWLDGGSVWLGMLDGLLFSLAGFALGFVLFFVMWILGACGGGDVKLFAAVAAWLGPTLAVMVLLITIVLVMAIVVVRIVWTTISRGRLSATQLSGKTRYGKPRLRLVWYSLPVALAVAFVVPWVCRFDLHLSAPHGTGGERVELHVPSHN